MFIKIGAAVTAMLLTWATYEWKSAPKWKRAAFVTVSVLSLAFTWGLERSDEKKELAREAKEESWKKEEIEYKRKNTVLLQAIHAAQGDAQALEAWRKNSDVVSKTLVETNNASFIELIEMAAAERSKERRGRELLNPELERDFEIKWRPTISFIVACIDARLENLKSQGRIASVESRDLKVTSEAEYESFELRTVTLSDGKAFTLTQEAAHAQNGQIGKFRMVINLTSVTGRIAPDALDVEIYAAGMTVSAASGIDRTGKWYLRQETRTVEEEEVRRKIEDAVDTAILTLMVEAKENGPDKSVR